VQNSCVEYFITNDYKANYIEDYVDGEKAFGRKRVEDTESVIVQQQEDTQYADKAGLTARLPKN
jgi:hypothetical protein